MLQTSASEVALIDEYDITASRDPPITIIHADCFFVVVRHARSDAEGAPPPQPLEGTLQ